MTPEPHGFFVARLFIKLYVNDIGTQDQLL
jgi:hypothetical protein